jgi:hypothetical protein
MSEKPSFFAELKRCSVYRAGDDIALIKVDSMLFALHGHPRFGALAEKIVPAGEFGKAVTQK